MRTGAIRSIKWGDSSSTSITFKALTLAETELATVLPAESEAAFVSPPASAVDEAKQLLHIAAEVEGALLAQYLYTAYSVLSDVVVNPPGAPNPIVSDDWYDTIRLIAKQEMGHLITVQNLLLALNAPPHLDRENFPIDNDLYPFPFQLQALGNETLAKAVAAEAPGDVRSGDRVDYQKALADAKIAVGAPVSRVGKIYERLYFLFQDSNAPQAPWPSLVNPFPDWPSWHVDASAVGFNQDRQAQPTEWHVDGSAPPDTVIYVLPIADKAAAREAIYKVSLQGEGPIDGQGEGITHFDKFLRLYREYQLYKTAPTPPPMARTQVTNPSTVPGKPGLITDPAALAWAKLANARYEMLLLDIALALSIGSSGSVPGTSATRTDFLSWALITEMRFSIKNLGQQLRVMPLHAGSPDSLLAGLPFELPSQADLPVTVPEQVAALRKAVARSQAIRKEIQDHFNPVGQQPTILSTLSSTDLIISAKIGTAAGPGT